MKAIPCMVGSAFRNKGVQCVLDAAVLYLPSPLDVVEPQKGTLLAKEETKVLKASDADEMVCLAWKVVHDHRMGLITYFKVISGVLNSGKMVVNTKKLKISSKVAKERLNKVALLKGQDMELVPKVTAGNIGAIIGLKNVATGDTLMYPDAKKSHLVVSGVSIPPPVFFRSIEPQSIAEQDKLDLALSLLNKEDPSFQISVNEDTGQMLVGGMGELHLEYILNRLESHYKVTGIIGDIMIAYRCAPKEEMEKEVEVEHSYEIGPSKTLHGRVRMSIYSGDMEDACDQVQIEDSRVVEWDGDEKMKSQDKKALEAVKEGVEAACNRGNSYGYPMVNIGANLLEWDVEGDVQSGDFGIVLKVCAEKAVREVFNNDEDFSVLEPAMLVEIRTENDVFGSISSDLASARRGIISNVRLEDQEKVATAVVPLKEMIGYSSQFRQRTGGRGSYSMEFKNYIVKT
jgi:elongation factor G